jgi:hypothetical protein
MRPARMQFVSLWAATDSRRPAEGLLVSPALIGQLRAGGRRGDGVGGVASKMYARFRYLLFRERVDIFREKLKDERNQVEHLTRNTENPELRSHANSGRLWGFFSLWIHVRWAVAGGHNG